MQETHIWEYNKFALDKERTKSQNLPFWTKNEILIFGRNWTKMVIFEGWKMTFWTSVAKHAGCTIEN